MASDKVPEHAILNIVNAIQSNMVLASSRVVSLLT